MALFHPFTKLLVKTFCFFQQGFYIYTVYIYIWGSAKPSRDIRLLMNIYYTYI